MPHEVEISGSLSRVKAVRRTLQQVGLPCGETEDYDHVQPRSLLDRRLPRSVVTEVCGIPALSDSELDQTRWDKHFVGAWSFDEPIHMLEGRVTLRGLEVAASDPRCHGLRPYL